MREEESGLLGAMRIDRLEVFAYHGVLEREQEEGQTFFVSAELLVPTRQPGRTDELADAVDYGAVCHFIDRFLRGHTYRLIETAAERLAEALLLTFAPIRQVRLRIDKPSAPIGLPFESVSVSVCRGWSRAYLSLGSNLGDRERYLREAVSALAAHPLIRLEQQSGWIETKPYGGVEQGDFLNGALSLQTLLAPSELLQEMQRLEQEAGRTREVHWGPRTLDLDLLFYDDLVLGTPQLILPHPDLQNRRFVLEPLCRIAPWHRHPVLRQTMAQLLAQLPEEAL